MKKYFYIQSGLKLWYKLAVELKNKSIAEPALCIGDNGNFELLKNKFDCEITKFHDQYSIAQYDLEMNELANQFFLSNRYNYVKDVCLKMMDREDIIGVIRQIDREPIFYSWLIWCCNKIEAIKPDFLLMSESPHSSLQYLMYELCEFFSVKTFSFGMITKFSPVIYLRHGIYGDKIELFEKPYSRKIDQLLFDRAEKILKSDSRSGQALNQLILYHQKQIDNKFYNLNGRLVFLLREIIKSFIIWLPFKVTKRLFTKKRPFQLVELEKPIFKRYNFSRHKIRRVQEKIWKELENKQKKYTVDFRDSDYVYLSLHYEPERNSCPDGHKFYEQIKAISAIRSILPNTVELLVKEHPSQTSRARIGYLGRSSFFYEAISKIVGVNLISSNISSEELISEAQFTVSLGGTMSLESALRGKRSIVFGTPWFKGAPNIIEYNDALTYENILNSELHVEAEIIAWIKDFIFRYGMPGNQNPSGEKYFSDLQDNNELWSSGLDAMVYAVALAINKVAKIS